MDRLSSCDIIITGSGPAGLAAACLLAANELHVICVAGKAARKQADPRTVALMLPSIRLLHKIGIWPGELKVDTAALRKLRLIDDTGNILTAPTVTFGADEIGEDAFGWNIPVERLVECLQACAERLGVTFRHKDAAAFRARREQATVRLEDGSELTGRLVLAADGRESKMRATAGISALEWSYDQAAIATSFGHSAPHCGISTEFHKTAGPLTTVPMPGNKSSLVWMETPALVDRLMTLSDQDFAKRLQFEIHGKLGLVSEIGPRRSFPMRGLTATSFAKQRLFLIGEAAHVVPPIGAQGLNMSLRDAALAAELVSDAVAEEADPGSASVAEAYNVKRRRDVLPRQAMVHTLNASLLASLAPFHSLRALGLSTISQFGPLRERIIREGLAPQSDLPRIMRA